MEEEHDYYQKRAEAELEMASNAIDPAAAKAHYKLAGLYLDRIHGPGDLACAAEQSASSEYAWLKGRSADN